VNQTEKQLFITAGVSLAVIFAYNYYLNKKYGHLFTLAQETDEAVGTVEGFLTDAETFIENLFGDSTPYGNNG
jgi:hypothetical protein